MEREQLKKGASAEPPPTRLPPDQIQRIEVNRLKAKALREQREAEAARDNRAAAAASVGAGDPGAGSTVAGTKRPYSATLTSRTPSTLRDGRAYNTSEQRPLDSIRPARNFSKYVEYDFSKMTDTKGGFLTAEDDPHNKVLHSDREYDGKPAHMTQKEWERQQLLQNLRKEKAGPFEPGLSVLSKRAEQKKCRECGTVEIDWKWEEIFKCCVCHGCKDKYPDKYSLLTKTEAKEDYLLTDPELKDEELLPHMERPNPHKSTWNNMMLFLRYQVEEYAFSPKKWGSPEALDAEFERREAEKKRRKEAQFKTKLQDLKKRTRVEAYRRSRLAAEGGAGGNFGDDLGGRRKHVHQWGRAVENPETGIGVKTCVDCGMEVEELEF
ncbi:DNA repair protein [Coccidioides posadasii C735 delta SOWgp]|uniref:DNA repair protein RAD14 n=2 Tax=Coccidioides posadasii TaxID=199306 RepID=A0A0J6FET3_COCPO|nr:DNA repair protein [Coccidioides posadasii C735 delta SOWgp]EER27552.1 DNA repair protein [Coccidioides posadasii C735 delta SOWgp]KMM67409.1 DNA repair protein RAD14 [Coccidioides posadasii RMSCC 3488]|eukprot:XP_003069697.1 DNA repair protein [Coccidioides posadasii C735 delta SOWgp]